METNSAKFFRLRKFIKVDDNRHRGMIPINSLEVVNFKIFSSLKIDQFSWVNVIIGANGTGKTSLLWALILALRSHNLYYDKKDNPEDLKNIYELGDDFSVLINCPHYAYASWRHITHNGSKTADIKATVLNQNICCNIKDNGNLTLSMDPLPENYQTKVLFAFMSESIFKLHSGQGEGSTQYLTSGAANSRTRFMELEEKYQKEITKHMKFWFGIKDLVMKDNGGCRALFVTEETNPVEIEIMFTGAALRKVFTALVLFYTLVQNVSEHKVYILEEPEAHLYPTLQESFVSMILSQAEFYHIQLFLTTNSQKILTNILNDNVIVLQKLGNKIQATHVDDDLFNNAIRFPLLGIHPTIPLILTEGDHDKPFIIKMAEVFGFGTNRLQILSCGKFKDSSNFSQLIESIHRVHPGIQIRLVCDLDFAMYSPSELSNFDEKELTQKMKNPPKVIYWDLPTIESYLFLHWCQHTNNPFKFLSDKAVLAKFMAKYLYCCRNQNEKIKISPKKYTEKIACNNWLDTSQLFNDQNPSIEVCVKVTKVIHGHTWLKTIKTNQTKLLNELHKGNSIKDIYPDLKKILNELLTF